MAAVAGPKLEVIDDTGEALAELVRDAGRCIDVGRDEDLFVDGGEMASLASSSGMASGSGMDRAGGSWPRFVDVLLTSPLPSGSEVSLDRGR